jgi:signal transduction histidine kinase
MKLLTKYNRVNAAATIVVLLLSGIIYYFFIEAALVHQLDKSLDAEKQEIVDFVKENGQLPEPSNDKDEQETFKPADHLIHRSFSTIQLKNKPLSENILYRQLQFPITVKGNLYKIEVRKSQEETEDLVQLILKISMAVVIILLVTLFIINRFVLNKLWKPFNTTLDQIKEFNISGTKAVKLSATTISEFKELNTAVTTMTSKAIRDYNEIKSFTENASHEIQTPLAIISSKLELLSQSNNLQEEQMNAIQSISETTNRLSRLNQSLLLLTKIDNKQFKKSGQVNVSVIIEHVLNNYEELIQAKEIVLKKEIQQNIEVTMNETLAEILIINLLANAIKHNLENGTIEILLNQNRLIVSNTGKAPSVEPAAYFERFKKGSDSSDSLGLGLSIVLKICESYNFSINYHYAEMLHKITISFPSV